MSTISYPSFSIPLFTQLFHRLRHTNARYNHIAHQCRHTHRPTHHAKRRAYRVGLRIDTSKTQWPVDVDLSASSTQAPSPISLTESEEDGGALGLRGLPAVVPAKVCLSPLELEVCQGPVPGAPRMRPWPLPDSEDE